MWKRWSLRAPAPPPRVRLQTVDDPARIACEFNWLRQQVVACDALRHGYHLEYGISGSGPYLYVQKYGRDGTLIEQTHLGWQLSQACKIVSRDTFVRAYEPFEHVHVFAPENGKGWLMYGSEPEWRLLKNPLQYLRQLVSTWA